MRISDWSSDVCSSDLLPAFDITAFWTKSGVANQMIPSDQEPFPCRPGFGDHTTALAMCSAILAALHERHQIGRASCRERVCQYVSISVVAVPLKKKQRL